MRGSDGTAAVQLASLAESTGMAKHIRTASNATGVSFDYLMAQAGKESSFSSDAKSTHSSAAGLFQFTKNTWLQLVKRHGAAHGLGDLADQIEHSGKGEYSVADPETRQKILALRRDPALSSLIAGEYARDNKHLLEKNLGHKVGSTELYLAHFLGPAGAVKLLKAREENPDQAAALLVPQAAAKNKTMFYDSDHSAQSVASLYNRVQQVMDNPAHPPSRQVPPAELAATALRYGDLPWADKADDMADPEKLLSLVKLSIQAYTEGAKSADRISAPMPPSPVSQNTTSDATAPDPVHSLFKELFG